MLQYWQRNIDRMDVILPIFRKRKQINNTMMEKKIFYFFLVQTALSRRLIYHLSPVNTGTHMPSVTEYVICIFSCVVGEYF